MTKHLTCLLLLFFSCHTRADSPPTPELIKQWWAKHSDEEIVIEKEPITIHLKSKKLAYLAEVGFYHRGRNMIWHSILIREDLEEVREVDGCVRVDNAVYDLDQDGVSEVVSMAVGSGQGNTNVIRTILQFDEWAPAILFQREFSSFDGMGENHPSYREKDVDWQFVDLDKDGKLDLAEVTTIKNGRNNRPPVVETIRRKFMFKNNTFIKYVDYKNQLPR